MDQRLPSLTKKTVESSLVSSQRSGPKELDSSGIQAYAARFGKLSRKPESLLLPGERVFHLLHARKCSEIGSIQETRASGRHLSCSAV